MRVKRISLHKNRAVQCPEATGSHVGIWMVLSGQVAYQTSLEVNLLRSFERLELFKFASDLTPPAQEHRNLTIITLNPEQNFLNTKTKPLKYSSSYWRLFCPTSSVLDWGYWNVMKIFSPSSPVAVLSGIAGAATTNPCNISNMEKEYILSYMKNTLRYGRMFTIVSLFYQK